MEIYGIELKSFLYSTSNAPPNTGVWIDFGDNPSKLDFFEKVFSEEVIQLIVNETNRYAGQKISKMRERGTLRSTARATKWTDVDTHEMKAFIATILLMEIIKMPTYKKYWTMNPLISIPGFRQIMSRDRFLLILQFLHLNNNERNLPQDNPNHDRLFKLRPFMDMLVNLWQGAYYPCRDVAVDETLIAFKGRTFFKQYKPKKPHKWGINAWTLAESKSGYVYNWDLYTGKPRDGAQEMGMTHRVVRELVEPIFDRGRHVYMDNYFTSPQLFQTLKDNDTGACGTLKLNRRGVPAAASQNLRRGDPPKFTREGPLLFVYWIDKRQVNLLSSIHSGRTFEKKVRCKRGDGEGNNPYKFVEKPIAVELYTINMGGVDRADQKAAYFVNQHCNAKWWKKVFFHMLEVAIVNATIIHKEHFGLTRVDATKFRLRLAAHLLEGYDRPSYRSGRRSDEQDLPTRLVGRHFPAKLPGNSRRDCVVCSQRKDKNHPDGKRHSSYYWCAPCQTGLCPYPCFERYHTLRDYKVACSDALHNA